jgi:hypothetical protein
MKQSKRKKIERIIMRKNQSQCSEKENEIDKRERNRVKVKDIEKET